MILDVDGPATSQGPSARRFAATHAQVIVTAGLAILAVCASFATSSVLVLLYLATVTPRLWLTDVAERRLPNRLVMPGYGIAAVGLAAHWIVTGDAPTGALLAGAAWFVGLWVLAALGGMGMGDVKLAGLIGFATGGLGATALLVPTVAFAAGGVAAAIVLMRGRRRATIAFGPYLLVGLWSAVAATAVVSVLAELRLF